MSQVTVDTLLLESNTTAKAILQLIPVLNITNLVIGTKKPLSTRFGTFSFLGFLHNLNKQQATLFNFPCDLYNFLGYLGKEWQKES